MNCVPVILIAALLWTSTDPPSEPERVDEVETRLTAFEREYRHLLPLAEEVGIIDAEAAYIADFRAGNGDDPALDAWAAALARAHNVRLGAALAGYDLADIAATPGGPGLLADIAMLSGDPDLLADIVDLIRVETERGGFHPLYFQTLERRLAEAREASSDPQPPAQSSPVLRDARLTHGALRVRLVTIGAAAGRDDWSRDLIVGHLKADWPDASHRVLFETEAGAWIATVIDQPNAELVYAELSGNGLSEILDLSPPLAATAVSVVQHAGTPAQMRDVLTQIEPYALSGAFNTQTYALLHDRVAVRHGEAQRYGTQIICEQGEHIVYRLESPDDIDRRRTQMGLRPLAEYVALYQENGPPCEP